MAKMLGQNFRKLEALYSTLLEIKLMSGSDVESNLTEIFQFLKNPYLRADKYYPTCGVNEILLRLVQCLHYFQTSGGSAGSVYHPSSLYNNLSKASFLCLTSRPKQHENYKSASRSMEDLFCSDLAAAYIITCPGCTMKCKQPSKNYKSANRSMEDVFCSDPAAAYIVNLSWLYYEVQAAQ
uniref:Uncharacterized protein n=1 Tax=Cacopsylla melanoneura TaxID=428564 RepID=A0A8D8SVF9_9HEMI